jgi:uncharacterized damage-inducible protein DinB
MSDQKPPRVAGSELETVLALLQYQRESLARKLTGVSDEAARARFVDSDTSLLWLAKHMTRAETVWFLHRFAGLDVPVPDDTVLPDDSLEDAVATYRAMWPRVERIVASASLDDLCARPEPALDPVNLRWVLMHLLEETARHAGHADILRELIDGDTGR